MKNKFLKYSLIVVLLFSTSFKVLSEEFEIKATKITLSDNGNILKAEDNILINHWKENQSSIAILVL